MDPQTYADYLATRGLELGTFALDERGTLRGHVETPAGAPARPDHSLELGDTLGEGGMGIVRLGRQPLFDREVAVKTARSPATWSALLREGWVTGHLQHPNIVPLYTLDTGEDGGPVLVMKRVEGASWAALIGDPEAHPWAFDGLPDPLSLHLDVFDRVCQAVAYAHARGIVHRDLKPDNIMVGRFGEVTVLDWGMAAALEAGTPLPQLRDLRRVEGTPAYLAPEMARADGPQIGPHSDVYLLGATLHHAVVGTPPHGGATLAEVLAHSFSGALPTYDDTVPSELVDVLLRAMAPAPEDRFQDVERLRRAVARFREHRTSNQLADEAHQRAAALTEAVRAGADAALLGRLSVEARFAYELALRTWPENPGALSGRRDLLLGLFTLHLDRKDRHAAQEVLDALVPAPDDAASRLSDLDRHLAEEAERQTARANLERDANKARGARAKARSSYRVGIAMGVLAAVFQVSESSGHPVGIWAYAMAVGAYVVVAGIDTLRTRKRGHNTASLRQLRIIWLAQFALVVTGGFAVVYDWPVPQLLAVSNALASLMAGLVAQLYFLRMTAAAAAWMAAALVCVLLPDFAWLASAVGGTVGFIVLGRAWEAQHGQVAH